MTLEELARTKDSEDADEVKDGEICEAGTEEEETTIEEDLQTALDYLEQFLLLAEEVTVKGGKIIRVPQGMMDLMEDVSEFLDKWEDVET